MKKPCIIITAVGSLVGKVVLDTLDGRRDGLCVVGCDISMEAANLVRCDEQETVRASGTPAWEGSILDAVRRHRPFALIPGIDGDVLLLAKLAGQYREIATVFVGGSASMADVISYKSRTAAFSLERGLPFADTLSTDHPEARVLAKKFVMRHGFPLIAKPDDGSGSIGVRILT
jgi:biotin carboxylase